MGYYLRPFISASRRRPKRADCLPLLFQLLLAVPLLVCVVSIYGTNIFVLSRTATTLVATGAPARSVALPTLTPTALPTLTPTAVLRQGVESPASSAQPPAPAANPVQSPAGPPPDTAASAPPDLAGWSFANVRTDRNPDNTGLVVFGNLVNGTGQAQEIRTIGGTFYDARGQVVAGLDSTYAFWAGSVVPPGGMLPFEVFADGIHQAARYDLSLRADPGPAAPHRDFELSDLTPRAEAGVYCLAGKLRNTGHPLEAYLVIAVTLYDHQDNVLNFGDDTRADPIQLAGDQPVSFEVCVPPPNSGVTRYDVQAWGQ